MAVSNSGSRVLHDLAKNHVVDQKRELTMAKGMTKADLEIRNYWVSVFNRALGAIAIPILVWLIMETFFK